MQKSLAKPGELALALAFAFLAAGTTVRASATTIAPIAHWMLDEGAGDTAFDSAGDHHGSLVGDVDWVAGRITGHALEFGGAGDCVYILGSAGTESELNIYNSDLTLVAWVKPAAGGTIIARGQPNYVTYWLRASATSACVSVYTSGHYMVCAPPDTLISGAWHHLVGVLDRTANRGRLYVDGQLVAEDDLPDPPPNAGATKIGCRNDELDMPYEGLIDEVAIFDQALSAAEVWELYAEPGPVRISGHAVDDDQENNSSGNGDGMADCGETIELYVELLNQGTGAAAEVEASFGSLDPYFSGFLFNESSSYGELAPGQRALNLDDFDLHIPADTPHGHAIALTGEVFSTSGGPWTDTFDLQVNCARTCGFPNELHVSGHMVMSPETYEACERIFVGPEVAVMGPSGALDLRAPTIVFRGPFLIVTGGTVSARSPGGR